jgi:hypothetical protein
MHETCFPRPLSTGILQKHGSIPQRERPRAKDSVSVSVEKGKVWPCPVTTCIRTSTNLKSRPGAKTGEAKHLKFAAATAKLVPAIGSGESLQAVGKQQKSGALEPEWHAVPPCAAFLNFAELIRMREVNQ